jgi:Icc-related predicted phosphoesterase
VRLVEDLMATKLRIFYAADIHGSERCFRKFLNAGKVYNADVIILGGDLTGKIVVPILQRKDGSFEVKVFGRRHYGTNPEELARAEAELGASGLHPEAMTEDELAEIVRQPERQKELFREAIQKTVRGWVGLADERLAATGIECYIMLGNDDDPMVGETLSTSVRIVNPDLRVVTVGGSHEMVSVGFSNRTPFDSPREMDEDKLEAVISKLASGLKDRDGAIFNLHCPPYGVGLDLAPALDADRRIISYGGQARLVPVGSTAVYRCIEKFQPCLSIHGHIHESRGMARIGRTVCLNPGSEYGEGILHGVIVDLDGPWVHSYQFVAG